MKKLKTLCAVLGIASMMYAGTVFAEPQKPSLAKKQKFDVPEYSLEGAEEKTDYFVFENNGSLSWIDNPSKASGLPGISVKVYGVDRNKDGKIDLWYNKIIVSIFNSIDTSQKDSFKLVRLGLDDDFDGHPDRLLIDSHDEDLKVGADGIYDTEQYLDKK